MGADVTQEEEAMQHVITLIPGDGIGPEVTKPTLKIIKASGVKVKWEPHLAGAEALKKHGTTIPKQLIHSFEKNKIALKGPVTTPVGEGFASVASGTPSSRSCVDAPFARIPSPEVAFACGSRSTRRTRSPASARHALRLTAVVVLPTPPFWFATA